MNDVDTGALGASGRFARMEAALDRIELKLDLKADVAMVTRVEGRVSNIEQLIADSMSGKVVAPISQMYLQRFETLESTVADLDLKDRQKAALVSSAKDAADRRMRLLTHLVGIATVFNVSLAVISFVVPK